MFNKLVDERLDEITKLDEKANHDDLIYRYKDKTNDENFNTYDDTLNIIIDQIKKTRKIKLAEAKNDQLKLKLILDEIVKWSNKKRLKEQKNKLYNIEMLYKARNKTIRFYDNYYLIASEGKNKVKNKANGKGLKILTSK